MPTRTSLNSYQILQADPHAEPTIIQAAYHGLAKNIIPMSMMAQIETKGAR